MCEQDVEDAESCSFEYTADGVEFAESANEVPAMYWPMELLRLKLGGRHRNLQETCRTVLAAYEHSYEFEDDDVDDDDDEGENDDEGEDELE
jgi:hypothetical protein